MHFEFLVEDQSGGKMLENLVPKIIGSEYSFRIHSYKGVGRIPKNMRDPKNASNRILLENLPKLLKGHGRTFAGYGPEYPAVVVLVCDLDDKSLSAFRTQLYDILNLCNPMPETRFCIAIEEGEAWFLGDVSAIKQAYPSAKDAILYTYENDSICGTWELLADAIFEGGAQALSANGWHAVGREKSTWAQNITPHMNLEENASPSFCYFRDEIRKIIDSN